MPSWDVLRNNLSKHLITPGYCQMHVGHVYRSSSGRSLQPIAEPASQDSHSTLAAGLRAWLGTCCALPGSSGQTQSFLSNESKQTSVVHF